MMMSELLLLALLPLTESPTESELWEERPSFLLTQIEVSFNFCSNSLRIRFGYSLSCGDKEEDEGSSNF